MITTAKALSSGYVPLAAVILHDKVHGAIATGSGHMTQGFTYSGHPLCSAVGLAVLQYLKRHALVENAARIGRLLLQRLDDPQAVPDRGGRPRDRAAPGGGVRRRPGHQAAVPPEAGVTRRIVEAALAEGVMVVGGMSGMIHGEAGGHIQTSPPTSSPRPTWSSSSRPWRRLFRR